MGGDIIEALRIMGIGFGGVFLVLSVMSLFIFIVGKILKRMGKNGDGS